MKKLLLHHQCCSNQNRYKNMKCYSAHWVLKKYSSFSPAVSGFCACLFCYCRKFLNPNSYVPSVGHHSFPTGPPPGIDHSGPQPPVRPTPRPDVQPLPSGTHLVYAQNGRIEHIPLEGYDMKPDQAKTVLHLPVSLLRRYATYCCSDQSSVVDWRPLFMGNFPGWGFPEGFSKMFDMWFE